MVVCIDKHHVCKAWVSIKISVNEVIELYKKQNSLLAEDIIEVKNKIMTKCLKVKINNKVFNVKIEKMRE
ncbi:MAG: hypothetical protein WBF68_02950 [Atribacterota bacterium]